MTTNQNQITTTNSKALAIAAGSMTAEQVDLVKRTICKGATDDELQMFIGVCARTGLDPFAKQIFAVKRWDKREQREVMAIQISADGFRSVAARSGEYEGQQGPFFVKENGDLTDVWLSEKPPAGAKVAILRSGFKEPIWAFARFSAYVQVGKDGQPTSFWKKFPELMIGKVAECLAIRKAFPLQLGGVYSPEEMMQAEDVDASEMIAAKTASKTKALKEKVQNVLPAPKNKPDDLAQAECDPVAKAEIKEAEAVPPPVPQAAKDQARHEKATKAAKEGAVVIAPAAPQNEPPKALSVGATAIPKNIPGCSGKTFDDLDAEGARAIAAWIKKGVEVEKWEGPKFLGFKAQFEAYISEYPDLLPPEAPPAAVDSEAAFGDTEDPGTFFETPSAPAADDFQAIALNRLYNAKTMEELAAARKQLQLDAKDKDKINLAGLPPDQAKAFMNKATAARDGAEKRIKGAK